MDAQDLKHSINLLTLIGQDTQLKRVASTNGGEFAGACPFCGGEDRFRVQPFHHEGGRFFCRGCDNHGDLFDYLQRREGMTFREVMKYYGREETPSIHHIEQPAEPEINRECWQDAANKFIQKSIDELWSDDGQKPLSYLLGRGLNHETLYTWKIGYNALETYPNPQEWGLPEGIKIMIPAGITIPCVDRWGLHFIKIRQKSGEPRYKMIKGSQMWLYGGDTSRDAVIAYLFEGELDCLLAWQCGLRLSYFSLPAGQKIRVEYGPILKPIEDIILCFDGDTAGREAAAKLKNVSHFYNSRPLPIGKDLTEYFLNGGDVLEWLLEQLALIPPAGVIDGS